MKNYYSILQVDPAAEADIIRAAYKRLALKHHPDVNADPMALQRMQELNEAFAVLESPDRRAAYDVQRQREQPMPQDAAHHHDAASVARLFQNVWRSRYPHIPLVNAFTVHAAQAYRLDFAHPQTQTGIALDGYQADDDQTSFTNDRQRDQELQRLGWRVLHFRGAEITHNAAHCADEVYAAIQSAVPARATSSEGASTTRAVHPPPVERTTAPACASQDHMASTHTGQQPTHPAASSWWRGIVCVVGTIASGALAALAALLTFALIGGSMQLSLVALCALPLLALLVFCAVMVIGRFLSTLHMRRAPRMWIPVLWIVVCFVVYSGYLLILARSGSTGHTTSVLVTLRTG